MKRFTFGLAMATVNQVSSVALADDHENAAFGLANGDRLTGVFVNDTV